MFCAHKTILKLKYLTSIQYYFFFFLLFLLFTAFCFLAAAGAAFLTAPAT